MVTIDGIEESLVLTFFLSVNNQQRIFFLLSFLKKKILVDLLTDKKTMLHQFEHKNTNW